jgi:hypothetical protein
LRLAPLAYTPRPAKGFGAALLWARPGAGMEAGAMRRHAWGVVWGFVVLAGAGQHARAQTAAPDDGLPRTSVARVTKGSGSLPNDEGQVWREYDLTPYTLRVSSTARPEQAVVDWVLRETGYEAWHGTPVALLSADSRTLRVYHTPQVQQVVAEMVDRFVNTESDTQAFGVRVCTVGHPNWRAKAMRSLQPVAVQTQGVQAWLLAKEDAAFIVSELRRRADFREHSSSRKWARSTKGSISSSALCCRWMAARSTPS